MGPVGKSPLTRVDLYELFDWNKEVQAIVWTGQRLLKSSRLIEPPGIETES